MINNILDELYTKSINIRLETNFFNKNSFDSLIFKQFLIKFSDAAKIIEEIYDEKINYYTNYLNTQYKNKYLKYKNKYIELKNKHNK